MDATLAAKKSSLPLEEKGRVEGERGRLMGEKLVVEEAGSLLLPRIYISLRPPLLSRRTHNMLVLQDHIFFSPTHSGRGGKEKGKRRWGGEGGGRNLKVVLGQRDGRGGRKVQSLLSLSLSSFSLRNIKERSCLI